MYCIIFILYKYFVIYIGGLKRISVHLKERVYLRVYLRESTLYSSTARFKKVSRFISPLSRFISLFSRKDRGKFAECSRKVHGKFAESPRESRDREEEKKRETGGFARGRAKLVIPDYSRSRFVEVEKQRI